MSENFKKRYLMVIYYRFLWDIQIFGVFIGIYAILSSFIINFCKIEAIRIEYFPLNFLKNCYLILNDILKYTNRIA
ncbi:hypothetical protein M2408_003891 [Sphingobacterium sp. BIGb0165]|nr:hypothetical protein [Sphingobacterium sp. BIGb0165]